MSVQLIVYPQSYEGEYNSISYNSNEGIVDGHDFNLVNGSLTYVVATPNPGQILIDGLYLTLPVNTWVRYNTAGATEVSAGTFSSGGFMSLDPLAAGTIGIIQKLSNLTVGATYTAWIDVTNNGSLPTFNVYDNPSPIFAPAGVPTLQSSQNIIDTGGLSPYTFTPTTSSPIIALEMVYVDALSVSTISEISIIQTGVSPTLMNYELADGQVICDLYEDEDIPLTLSVDNFKNAAEKVQSYSKAFKLPATKRNNLIFDNMFEVTREDDDMIFNPYKRTECVLKQDGFILFQGYLKMIEITDKEGEISYNVNLYSQGVALKDVLKDKTFSMIDFTELEHAYNKYNIERSWYDTGTGITYLNPSTSGFRDANDTVKYPFVDWNHQFIVSNGTLGNINNPQLTNLEQAFRPFINVKYLVNRIFQDTDFIWKSDFFDGDVFEDLYMDFNWGSDDYPVSGDTEGMLTVLTDKTMPDGATTTVIFDEMPGTTLAPGFGYDDTTGIFTAQNDGQAYSITYKMTFVADAPHPLNICQFRWQKNSGTVTSLITAFNASITYAGTVDFGTLEAGDTIKMTVVYNSYLSVGDLKLQDNVVSSVAEPTLTITTNNNFITNESLVQGNRGDLKQWEFLKGIMTMFNLVTLPDKDNPNIINLEPYRDIFQVYTKSDDINDMTLASRNIQHDWTDKIDVSEMKLKPLTDLQKTTSFVYKEDEDDFPFANYKRQVGGHLYGSKIYDATLASNGLATVLEGEKKVEAEPFAATVIKPLMAQYPDLIVPSLYAFDEDETKGIDNSPRILFNNGIKDLTQTTYYIPAQNTLPDEDWDSYLQFAHVSNIPVQGYSLDLNFGECQLIPPVGLSTNNNLYNLYWAPYYNELYNSDTRMMTIKVNLNPSDITTFKFNDTVILKNREYRVNKIDYKPNDLAIVEFILIP
jgi:hypothetical protein